MLDPLDARQAPQPPHWCLSEQVLCWPGDLGRPPLACLSHLPEPSMPAYLGQGVPRCPCWALPQEEVVGGWDLGAAHSLPLNLLCLSEPQVMALLGAKALEVSACPPRGSWPSLQGQSSRPGHQCLSQSPPKAPKFLPTCEILGYTSLSDWHAVMCA